MITLLSACVLLGCASDVPIIVSNDPVASYFQYVTKPKQREEKVKPACYINGEFFTSCPK
ncbi:MAG: hypothetical protein ACO3CD_08415 [Candidatus Nanopelagicaceae bacterium]